MTRRISMWWVLAFGLAFAAPAALVTNAAFRPLDEHIRLEGKDASHTFAVPDGEPLYLEYGVIVRAPDGPRPSLTIMLNGVTVATLSERLFATQGAKLLLPAGAVQRGANVLRATIAGPSSAGFEFGGRVQNYAGIAPDFPRLFVVSDEAVAYDRARRPLEVRAWQSAGFVIAGVSIVWLLAVAWAGRLTGVARGLALGAPSLLPWMFLAYGLATPRHIWLSLEALVVAALLGTVAVAGLLWVGRHRLAVLKVAAVMLLTLGVSEAGLRWFNTVRPSFVFYSDPAGRYRGQPGGMHYGSRLNSRGFNDVEHALARPVQVRRRIVALGDSFALGSVPYAENYLTVLESELAPDASIEVINMGVSGTDPVDYHAMLLQEGLAFRPDLVLVNLFVGNDFEDRGREWYEYSFVATLLHAVYEIARARSPAVAVPDGRVVEYRDDAPSMTRDRYLEIEVDRSWVYLTGADRLPSATSRIAGHLRAIRDAARRGGADVVIVVIPDEAQVNRGLQAEVLRAAGHSAAEMDFELPNRAIAAELANDGIPILDLLPAFRRESATTNLYKPQDTHWNIAGNRLAAREIARFLKALPERR